MLLQDLLTQSPYLKNITDFVINSSIDGIRAIDLEYRYIMWNPALERITGYKKEEVIGRVAFDVFPFLRDLGEDALFARAIAGETIYVSERAFHIPKTGRSGYFEAVYAPLYNDDRKIIGTFAIVRDVSEIKKTAMALNETELKLRNLNRVISDGLVTCDSKGHILSWNEGAESNFGYREEEALKLHISQILPDFQWKNEMRHLKSLGARSEGNLRMMGLRKNGSSMPIEITRSRWSMGLNVFLSLGLKDLSDFHHLENQANEFRDIGEAVLQVHNDLEQGILAVDGQTHQIVYSNHSFAMMLGYQPEELKRLPDGFLDPLLKEFGQKHSRHETSKFSEVKLRHKDGNLARLEVAARHIETSFGMVSLFILRTNSKARPLTQLAILE